MPKIDDFDFENWESLTRLHEILALIKRDSNVTCNVDTGYMCKDCYEFVNRKREILLENEQKAKLFFNLDELKDRIRGKVSTVSCNDYDACLCQCTCSKCQKAQTDIEEKECTCGGYSKNEFVFAGGKNNSSQKTRKIGY